jgi:hypothetical protein
VSIPEMIDKDTSTQCGDSDVSTPERIDQDRIRHIAVTTDYRVFVSWSILSGVDTSLSPLRTWVFGSLSVISGVDTSLSPLLTDCLCPYRSSLE